jgi:hypothetical protein
MKQMLWMALGALICAAVGAAIAQSPQGPNVIPGCVYNATPPTLSDKQQTTLQCDVNGKLKVTTS